MTKLTDCLFNRSTIRFKNRRFPQRLEPLKTRPLRDIALKNSVASRGASESNVFCIKEMMSLLDCMKLNDFNEKLCSVEKDVLQSCYVNYVERMKKRSEADSSEPIPGVNKFTKSQLNTLLSRYPQPLRTKE